LEKVFEWLLQECCVDFSFVEFVQQNATNCNVIFLAVSVIRFNIATTNKITGYKYILIYYINNMPVLKRFGDVSFFPVKLFVRLALAYI
jgi:hypothetical protein